MVDAGRSPVRWHYLSVATTALSPIVRWPAPRLHLVGPRIFVGWTLFASVDASGRYVVRDVAPDEDDLLTELLVQREEEGGGRGFAELRPYDADLVYSNGHVLSTEGVVGTAGGPPIGLYPNPKCPNCGVLMFHVLTVEHHVREYGDGFRALFVCEPCGSVACAGLPWN